MARRFDVFRLPGDVPAAAIQSDLRDAMATRVAVPLLPAGAAGPPMRGLNSEIRLGEKRMILTPQLAATLTLREPAPVCGRRSPGRSTSLLSEV